MRPLAIALLLSTACPRAPAAPSAPTAPTPSPEPAASGPCATTCRVACAQSDIRAKPACEAICAGGAVPPAMQALLCGAVDVGRTRVVAALTRQAISREAVRNLDDLFERSVRFFQIHRRFPKSAGPVPERLCAAPDGLNHPDARWWEHSTWRALAFRLERPFFYRYTYQSDGEGPGATFRVTAEGDLNCNGTLSRFQKSGTADHSGTVVGRSALSSESVGE